MTPEPAKWPHEPSGDEASPRRLEVRRVADALRSVIDRFVATEAPIDVFHGLADELEAIAGRLGEYPQHSLYLGYAEAANAGDSNGPFDNSPIMGASNPLAAPLRMTVEGDRVVGSVVFGRPYEGPPGFVHGGHVAAVFDEFLGMVQSRSGRPGMTGRLTVHYRAPTPLARELRLEGGIDRMSGRKIVCSGRLLDGDTLCADAEGLFVTIDAARFQSMRAARERG